MAVSIGDPPDASAYGSHDGNRSTSLDSTSEPKALALVNNRAKADQVALKLCNISPKFLPMFKLMRLKKISFANEEKALEAFQKKGWFG